MRETTTFAPGHDGLTIEFAGETYAPRREEAFTVGRDADLVVDDNPYLHRLLLRFEFDSGLWWLANIGQSISLTLSTRDGAYQAVVGPGTRVPIVFPRLIVLFSAGPYTYELDVAQRDAAFLAHASPGSVARGDGEDTITAGELTPSQLLLVLALCEPLLRDGIVGGTAIPTSADAAARLGWPVTTFNRKLDAVCDKLDRAGVPGLRGGVGKLATQRKARLVEHAIVSRLVTPDDLALLDTVPAPGMENDR